MCTPLTRKGVAGVQPQQLPDSQKVTRARRLIVSPIPLEATWLRRVKHANNRIALFMSNPLAHRNGHTTLPSTTLALISWHKGDLAFQRTHIHRVQATEWVGRDADRPRDTNKRTTPPAPTYARDPHPRPLPDSETSGIKDAECSPRN